MLDLASASAAGRSSAQFGRTYFTAAKSPGRSRDRPRQISLAAWSMVHGLSLLIIDGQLTGLCDAVIGAGAAVIAALAARRVNRKKRNPGA